MKGKVHLQYNAFLLIKIKSLYSFNYINYAYFILVSTAFKDNLVPFLYFCCCSDQRSYTIRCGIHTLQISATQSYMFYLLYSLTHT